MQVTHVNVGLQGTGAGCTITFTGDQSTICEQGNMAVFHLQNAPGGREMYGMALTALTTGKKLQMGLGEPCLWGKPTVHSMAILGDLRKQASVDE